MKKNKLIKAILAVPLLMILGANAVFSQTTEFSYQGFLSDNSASANGNFDFEFRLFDAATGGTLLGSRVHPNVQVTNGVFSVVLDFGEFASANRYLEIAVRPPGGGTVTTLAPRSKVLSTPYSTNAINAINATNAQTTQNALQLGGVAANQFIQTNDSRLSDARNPLPNSPNYINNSTTQQTTSNFNISGNGTAGGTLTGNIVNATTQLNINGVRVLTSPGSFNFFAGNGAGQSNTTGSSNSFFGVNAGVFNTTGGNNAFFGFEAGRNNNAGANNAYFGKDAGRSNNTGNDNAFFGNDAGQSNTTGGSNAFFGKGAGADNTTAVGNSFFGALAGNSNSTGANNAFFGFEAGRLSDTAFNNSFFGYQAGESNVIGLNNSFFGFNAGQLNTGSRNSFYGSGAGQVSTGGFHNTFIGGQAGGANTTGDDNTFVGLDSGLINTTGSSNTIIGANSNLSANNLLNATAIGANAFVAQSNALILGSVNGINGATSDTKVGIGTTTPLDTLDIDGIMRLRVLGSGGILALCHNINKQISTCSSSLRYKTDIAPFSSGLNIVNRLRPITFNWKSGGLRDLGLGAEDVAAVEPLLVTYNETGEVEGVKYDRVAVVLLNAVKEQQVQIEQQQKQLQQQQNLIEGLRKIVCADNPKVEFCQ
jgi:trimeric autotransporter adhesin